MFCLVLALHIKGNVYALAQQSHGTPAWASYHISNKHAQRYSVFEQLNQEHLRDMDAIDTLDNTIKKLLQHKQQVVLLSGQSGMVFFYTAKQYFGKVWFIDNRGLVDKLLVTCPQVDHIERSNQGLYFSLDGFLSLLPDLQQHCQVPAPDILYDINDMTRRLPQRLEQYQYHLIHKEAGIMLNNNSKLPAKTLPSPNFIMLKNELALWLDLTASNRKASSENSPAINVIHYKNKPLKHRF